MSEQKLQELWKDGSHKGSFLAPSKAYSAFKKSHPDITREKLRKAITNLREYALFEQYRRLKPTHGSHGRQIEAGEIGSSWHVDTAFVALPGNNSCFILLVDAFSRRAFFTLAQKSMSAEKATVALKKAIKEGGIKPATIYTGNIKYFLPLIKQCFRVLYNGSEFKNIFSDTCRQLGIKLLKSGTQNPNHSSLAERLIRHVIWYIFPFN